MIMHAQKAKNEMFYQTEAVTELKLKKNYILKDTAQPTKRNRCSIKLSVTFSW